MMAESSWWETLLARMFMGATVLETNRQRAAEPIINDGKAVIADIFGTDKPTPGSARAMSSPSPSPSASGARPAAGPTMAPNAPAPVGQKEDEAFGLGLQAKLGGVATAEANPLYGNVPDAKVYSGKDTEAMARNEKYSRGQGMYRDVDKTTSIQDILTGVNDWSEKKRKKFADLAVAAQLMKTPSIQYDDIEAVLGPLAIRAAKLYQNGVKVTPWSLLERYGAVAGVDLAAKLGPITTTSTSRNVNLSSARDANSLVDAALAARLGRAATDEEKKKFLASLNAAEKKEPTVTSTTTTTSGSGTENVSSNSSSKTSGGVNASSFAQEWSLGHNKDEAGSYQALSEYMPLFFQSLDSPI